MRKFLVRRPSPALAVSFVALVLVLGGTAYAGTVLGKNSVGTKQLKNGAVTNAKLGKGAVTTGKIKNGTVTASKINTSGLTVPNALQANSAASATNAANAAEASRVDGDTVTKVFANQVPNTAPATVYSEDGLTIQAGCNSSELNTLTATSTDPNAELNVLSDASDVSETDENTGTAAVDLFNGEGPGIEGSLEIEYANTAGQTVTLMLGVDYSGAFGTGVHGNCGVWGTGTGSS